MFHHLGRRLPLWLVCWTRVRLDGGACCALVLFTGPTAPTVGLVPPLWFEVSRLDSADVYSAAPPPLRPPSPRCCFLIAGSIYPLMGPTTVPAPFIKRGSRRI